MFSPHMIGLPLWHCIPSALFSVSNTHTTRVITSSSVSDICRFPHVGPAIGPVAGGFIAQSLGIKWVFIILASMLPFHVWVSWAKNAISFSPMRDSIASWNPLLTRIVWPNLTPAQGVQSPEQPRPRPCRHRRCEGVHIFRRNCETKERQQNPGFLAGHYPLGGLTDNESNLFYAQSVYGLVSLNIFPRFDYWLFFFFFKSLRFVSHIK